MGKPIESLLKSPMDSLSRVEYLKGLSHDQITSVASTMFLDFIGFPVLTKHLPPRFFQKGFHIRNQSLVGMIEKTFMDEGVDILSWREEFQGALERKINEISILTRFIDNHGTFEIFYQDKIDDFGKCLQIAPAGTRNFMMDSLCTQAKETYQALKAETRPTDLLEYADTTLADFPEPSNNDVLYDESTPIPFQSDLSQEYHVKAIRSACITEFLQNNTEMLFSQCGTALMKEAERDLFGWFYEQIRTRIKISPDVPISAMGRSYSYPVQDMIANIIDILFHSVPETNRDILNPGFALAFLDSWSTKAGMCANVGRHHDVWLPVVRVYADTPLEDFTIPANTDAATPTEETEPYVNLIFREVAKKLSHPDQLKAKYEKYAGFPVDYEYHTGGLTEHEFFEVVENAVRQGLRVYPLLEWDKYDPANQLLSSRHSISILGSDSYGNWRIYDPSYPRSEAYHYVDRKNIWQSLHNGQFVVMGCVDPQNKDGIKNKIYFLTSEEKRGMFANQLKLGFDRTANLGFSDRLELLQVIRELSEPICGCLDEVDVEKHQMKSFPGNIISAFQYTLMKNGLPQPVVTSSQEWKKRLLTVINNPLLRADFVKYLRRGPGFSLVERYIPVALTPLYLEKQRFSMIDLGCATNAGASFLSTASGIQLMGEIKNKMEWRNPHSTYIDDETGVDLNGDPDDNWARASFDPGPHWDKQKQYLEEAIQARNRYKDHRKIVSDIFTPWQRLVRWLSPFSEPQFFDVATSFFVLHQTGKSTDDLRRQVEHLLEERGLWYTAGFETNYPDDTYGIHLYQKIDGKLQFIAEIARFDRDQKTLIKFNMDHLQPLVDRNNARFTNR